MRGLPTRLAHSQGLPSNLSSSMVASCQAIEQIVALVYSVLITSHELYHDVAEALSVQTTVTQ